VFPMTEDIKGEHTLVLSGTVFAAEWNEAARRLTVHTCSKRARNAKSGLQGSMPNSGERLVIKVHRRRALLSPRSLEALSRLTNAEAIIYDPTEVFSRAALLVGMVHAVRETFAAEIAGYFFDTSSSTVMALARRDLGPAINPQIQQRLSDAMSAARRASRHSALPCMPIRVVSELPRFGRCVAIDAASARMPRHWGRFVIGAAAAVVSSGLLFGAAAHASTPNHAVLGSLSVFVGDGASELSNSFAASGIDFFFGSDGGNSWIEFDVAQGNSGLRIVVDPDRQVEDGPTLRRPRWATPFTEGAGPGS